jgi:hypothetical protein
MTAPMATAPHLFMLIQLLKSLLDINSLVQWSHQLNRANSIPYPLLKIAALTETSYQNNSLDNIINALDLRNLMFHEFNNFIYDRIKDRLHIVNTDNNAAT